MTFSKEIEQLSKNTHCSSKGVELSPKGETFYNKAKILNNQKEIFHDLTSPITAIPMGAGLGALATGMPAIIPVIALGLFVVSCAAIFVFPRAGRVKSIIGLVGMVDPNIEEVVYKKSTNWTPIANQEPDMMEKRHYLVYYKLEEKGVIEVIIQKNKRKTNVTSMKKYSLHENSKSANLFEAIDYKQDNPLMEKIDAWDKAFETTQQKELL